MAHKATIDSPLRLVHYLPGVPLEEGGVVRAVLDWCGVFASNGHRVTLLVYGDQGLPPEWKTPAERTPHAVVMQTPRGPGRLLNRKALSIAETVLRDAHVLHLHGPWVDGNRQLANLARKLGVPYVVSLHGMLDDWSMQRSSLKKRLYLRLVGRRFLQTASFVHCTAQRELDQAKKWIGNARTIVLPYLVDLKPFQIPLAPTWKNEQFTLLFLSRLHPQKGLDRLLHACANLRDAGRDFQLLIAGTGTPAYEAKMLDLVAQLHLAGRVRFLGLVTGNEKISLIQCCDLFVHPTRHENFGLVIIEAMACGAPVLITRGADPWEEFEKGGAVVTPDDRAMPAALASSIVSLMDDLPAARRRAIAGRTWVLDWLDPARLAREYETIYRRAISGG